MSSASTNNKVLGEIFGRDAVERSRQMLEPRHPLQRRRCSEDGGSDEEEEGRRTRPPPQDGDDGDHHDSEGHQKDDAESLSLAIGILRVILNEGTVTTDDVQRVARNWKGACFGDLMGEHYNEESLQSSLRDSLMDPRTREALQESLAGGLLDGAAGGEVSARAKSGAEEEDVDLDDYDKIIEMTTAPAAAEEEDRKVAAAAASDDQYDRESPRNASEARRPSFVPAERRAGPRREDSMRRLNPTKKRRSAIAADIAQGMQSNDTAVADTANECGEECCDDAMDGAKATKPSASKMSSSAQDVPKPARARPSMTLTLEADIKKMMEDAKGSSAKFASEECSGSEKKPPPKNLAEAPPSLMESMTSMEAVQFSAAGGAQEETSSKQKEQQAKEEMSKPTESSAQKPDLDAMGAEFDGKKSKEDAKVTKEDLALQDTAMALPTSNARQSFSIQALTSRAPKNVAANQWGDTSSAMDSMMVSAVEFLPMDVTEADPAASTEVAGQGTSGGRAMRTKQAQEALDETMNASRDGNNERNKDHDTMTELPASPTRQSFTIKALVKRQTSKKNPTNQWGNASSDAMDSMMVSAVDFLPAEDKDKANPTAESTFDSMEDASRGHAEGEAPQEPTVTSLAQKASSSRPARAMSAIESVTSQEDGQGRTEETNQEPMAPGTAWEAAASKAARAMSNSLSSEDEKKEDLSTSAGLKQSQEEASRTTGGAAGALEILPPIDTRGSQGDDRAKAEEEDRERAKRAQGSPASRPPREMSILLSSDDDKTKNSPKGAAAAAALCCDSSLFYLSCSEQGVEVMAPSP